MKGFVAWINAVTSFISLLFALGAFNISNGLVFVSSIALFAFSILFFMAIIYEND